MTYKKRPTAAFGPPMGPLRTVGRYEAPSARGLAARQYHWGASEVRKDVILPIFQRENKDAGREFAVRAFLWIEVLLAKVHALHHGAEVSFDLTGLKLKAAGRTEAGPVVFHAEDVVGQFLIALRAVHGYSSQGLWDDA